MTLQWQHSSGASGNPPLGTGGHAVGFTAALPLQCTLLFSSQSHSTYSGRDTAVAAQQWSLRQPTIRYRWTCRRLHSCTATTVHLAIKQPVSFNTTTYSTRTACSDSAAVEPQTVLLSRVRQAASGSTAALSLHCVCVSYSQLFAQHTQPAGTVQQWSLRQSCSRV